MRIPNVVCQLTNAELTEEEIPEFLAHPEQVHPGDEIFAVVETDNGKFLDEEIEIDPKEEPPRLIDFMASKHGRRFFVQCEPGRSGFRERKLMKNTLQSARHNGRTSTTSTMQRQWNCYSLRS